MARRGDVNLLTEDLFYELDRGKVYECHLRDPLWHLDGLQVGDNIYIDPRPSILETVVHELIHRRFPKWGERRVTKEARNIVGGMDERAKTKWFRKYSQVKRKGRPVDA